MKEINRGTHRQRAGSEVEFADLLHAVAAAEGVLVTEVVPQLQVIAVVSQRQHGEDALRVAVVVHPNLGPHHACPGGRVRATV